MFFYVNETRLVELIYRKADYWVFKGIGSGCLC